MARRRIGSSPLTNAEKQQRHRMRRELRHRKALECCQNDLDELASLHPSDAQTQCLLASLAKHLEALQ